VVSTVSALTLWLVLAAPGPRPSSVRSAGAAPAADAEAVRPVLADGRYPWYDARAGRVKPLLTWPDFDPGWWNRLGFRRLQRFGEWMARRFEAVARWFRWLNGWRIPGIGGMGDLFVIGLVLLFLTLVLVLLLELLRRYRPPAADDPARIGSAPAGSARRIEGMPAGVRLDAADPWAEAQRLRARGDYAGAVVHLFAHQLLALERAREVRLVPGRTGRQLVRAVGDRQLRVCVEPTLRLFEAVYYGHRAPSAEAFEAVWASAQAFERRFAAETPA